MLCIHVYIAFFNSIELTTCFAKLVCPLKVCASMAAHGNQSQKQKKITEKRWTTCNTNLRLTISISGPTALQPSAKSEGRKKKGLFDGLSLGKNERLQKNKNKKVETKAQPNSKRLHVCTFVLSGHAGNFSFFTFV